MRGAGAARRRLCGALRASGGSCGPAIGLGVCQDGLMATPGARRPELNREDRSRIGASTQEGNPLEGPFLVSRRYRFGVSILCRTGADAWSMLGRSEAHFGADPKSSRGRLGIDVGSISSTFGQGHVFCHGRPRQGRRHHNPRAWAAARWEESAPSVIWLVQFRQALGFWKGKGVRR